MAYERRSFGSGNALATTLTAQLTAGVTTSFAIAASTRWPDGTAGNFFVVIDPTTDLTNPNSNMEVIKCSTRSGLTVNIAASGRGAMGTSDVTHASGARVWVVGTTLDFDESNYWVAELSGASSGGTGRVVVSDGANSLTGLTGTSAQLIQHNGTTWVAIALSGDVSLAAGGAITIPVGTVTYAKMQDVSATDRLLGRDTAGAGDVEELTPAAVKTMLAIAGSDLTAGSVGTTQLTDDGVTAAKIATDAVGAAEIAAAAVGDSELAAAIPRGVLSGGYVEVTADQTGITTEADLTGLTVTVTAGTSRRLRISGYCSFVAVGGAADPVLFVKEGATYHGLAHGETLASGTTDTVKVEANVALSSGAHTFKLSALRVTGGAGSLTLEAGAASASKAPAFIMVEDVGAA